MKRRKENVKQKMDKETVSAVLKPKRIAYGQFLCLSM